MDEEAPGNELDIMTTALQSLYFHLQLPLLKSRLQQWLTTNLSTFLAMSKTVTSSYY